MTDRLIGFVVTLESPMREDDAEAIRAAIAQLRGVVSVTPAEDNERRRMNREMIRYEFRARLQAALEED